MNDALRELDVKLLQCLQEEGDRPTVTEVARRLGCDQSPVAATVTGLAERGLVEVEESAVVELRTGARAGQWEQGRCPERRVASALAAAGGRAGIRDLPGISGLEAREIGQSLKYLAQRNWASKQGAELTLGEDWKGDDGPPPQPDEILVAYLLERGPATKAVIAEAGIDVEAALALLARRPGVVEQKERRQRRVGLTAAGRERVAAGLEAREEVSELTTELLVSGRWKEVSFRAYDVSLPGRTPMRGKEHPFRRILEETRTAFLHMGFEETASPWVESAFWDFDALFQPQDHPARDMQDTFYVGRPATCGLPAEEWVERVRATHETGGSSGSMGWRYPWNRDLARRCVLRTHTTAATVRELARRPDPPRKVFCVGPVFRRETIDYKHLPVFHQVDGIVIDAQASFSALLTLLTTFYRKMGFEKIQFRPAFFPYTEPSVEVFVWMESRKDWVEMGGSGIFRPEVTEPLGCKVPVLAWGLGLERLAMFRYGLSDIRELYLSHLDWLKEVPQCR
ncbi:MAG: phenylalanine--tRNA ligase subunit alpha [Acidobacteriota bacterium]|nr:phenylalanine--tRNA ligase subunit alpha [Acidobacteriota bacterium]